MQVLISLLVAASCQGEQEQEGCEGLRGVDVPQLLSPHGRCRRNCLTFYLSFSISFEIDALHDSACWTPAMLHAGDNLCQPRCRHSIWTWTYLSLLLECKFMIEFGAPCHTVLTLCRCIACRSQGADEQGATQTVMVSQVTTA